MAAMFGCGTKSSCHPCCSHSARSWKGVNAIHLAGPVLARLNDYVARQPEIDGLTYQLGVGARYDFSNNFAVHASYRVTWIDLDNAEGTPDFDGVEVSVGWKF